MSKFAVLGDTHFGYRPDSMAYTKYVERFYTEIFLPYLIEHDIKTVIQTGDFFDNRKVMNISTMAFVRRVLLDPLKENNIKLITISGNHDLRNTNNSDLYSVQEFVSTVEYPNVTIINEIKEIDNIAYVPWINKGNVVEFESWVKHSSAEIVVGHFEFIGFEFAKGIENTHGLSRKQFKDYELVISGHFHTRSQQDNIIYVGIAYEMTWSDHGDQKGFHILDTTSKQLEYIRNPLKLYHKIFYDDKAIDYDSFDFSLYADTYVKVQVVNKTNDKMWERFTKSLFNIGPIDVNISETPVEYTEISADDIDLEDTLTTLSRAVEGFENVNHSSVVSHITEIYNEANTMSSE